MFATGTGAECGLGGQALPGEFKTVPTYLRNTVTLGKYNDDPVTNRWWVVQQWFVPWVGPWPTQYPTNASLQWQQAGPVGNIQIWEVPDVVPATVANPLPAIIAPPVGHQLPKDRPYPGALPRVNTWSKTVYARVAASTGAKANSKPGTVVVGRPGQVTLPTRRPPGPGVKERKVRATGALAGVNAALGVAAGVYEDAKFYNDVLNAWYNALPGNKNARTPAEKAWELHLVLMVSLIVQHMSYLLWWNVA